MPNRLRRQAGLSSPVSRVQALIERAERHPRAVPTLTHAYLVLLVASAFAGLLVSINGGWVVGVSAFGVIHIASTLGLGLLAHTYLDDVEAPWRPSLEYIEHP